MSEEEGRVVSEPITEHDLAEATIARLRLCGWTQGSYGPEEGPNCLDGALSLVARELIPGDPLDGRYQRPPAARLAAAIQREIDRRTGRPQHVTNWNDTPGRTVAEVLDVIRVAAAS